MALSSTSGTGTSGSSGSGTKREKMQWPPLNQPVFVDSKRNQNVDLVIQNYARCGYLTELNEQGEHLLFPSNVGPKKEDTEEKEQAETKEDQAVNIKDSEGNIVFENAVLGTHYTISDEGVVTLLIELPEELQPRDATKEVYYLDIITAVAEEEVEEQGTAATLLDSLDYLKIAQMKENWHYLLSKQDVIRNATAVRRKGLNTAEFMVLLRKYLKITDWEDIRNAQLIEVFELIDIGCANQLTWEDFTNFLVDQGMRNDVNGGFNVIKFVLNPNCIDETVHLAKIEKAAFFQNAIVYFENNNQQLRFLAPDLRPLLNASEQARGGAGHDSEEEGDGDKEAAKTSSTCPVKKKGARSRYAKVQSKVNTTGQKYQSNSNNVEEVNCPGGIITFEFATLEKKNYCIVSCTDLSLNIYDVDNSYKFTRKLTLPASQLVLRWSTVGRILFSADREGNIYGWDLQKILITSAGSTVVSTEPDGRMTGGAVLYTGQGGVEKSEEDTSKWSQKKIEREKKKKTLEELRALISEKLQNVRMNHSDPLNLGELSTSMLNMSSPAHSPAVTKRADGQARVCVSSIDRHMRAQDAVTAIIELSRLNQIATAGFDCNIIIWDIETGSCKRILKGHKMGVRCLAFADRVKQLLSGGFDNNVIVWNPYTGNSTHTIKGQHQSSIVEIVVFGYSKILSCDQNGVVKTWDLGSFQCLQTWNMDTGGTDGVEVRTLCSLPPYKRMIAGGKRFVAYDFQQTGGEPDQTDENPITKAVYSKKRFFIAAANYVKIWDSITGSVQQMITHTGTAGTNTALNNNYSSGSASGVSASTRGSSEVSSTNINDNYVTDFCIDGRGRKVYISDHAGRIAAYNTTTGAFIKWLKPHGSEVSKLMYWEEHKCLISVSWDSSVILHDEGVTVTSLSAVARSPNRRRSPSDMVRSPGSRSPGRRSPDRLPGRVLKYSPGMSPDRDRDMDNDGGDGGDDEIYRRVNGCHVGDITTIAISETLGYIATAGTDRVIMVREFGKLRLVGTLIGHLAKILALTFVDPYPILVSADGDGTVLIWALNQSHWQGTPLAGLSNPSDIKDPLVTPHLLLTRFLNIRSLEHAAPANCMAIRCIMNSDRMSMWFGPKTQQSFFNSADTDASPSATREGFFTRGTVAGSNTGLDGGSGSNTQHNTQTQFFNTTGGPFNTTGGLSHLTSMKAGMGMTVADGMSSTANVYPELLHIYIADDEGEIRCWDIGAVLQNAQIPPLPKARTEDTHRKDEIDAASGTSAIVDRIRGLRREIPTFLAARSAGRVVKHIVSWRAHEQGVTSLQILEDANRDNSCIVSAGTDRMCKIWKMNGELMCVLCAYGSTQWNFPFTESQDKERSHREVVEEAKKITDSVPL